MHVRRSSRSTKAPVLLFEESRKRRRDAMARFDSKFQSLIENRIATRPERGMDCSVLLSVGLWPEAGPRTEDGGFGGWRAKAWDKSRRR